MLQVIQQSQSAAALRRVYFWLLDTATGTIGQTGKTLAIRVGKNDESNAGAAGTVTEVDLTNLPGLYYYEPTQAEVGVLGTLVLYITEASSLTRRIHVSVVKEGSGPGEGANAVTVKVEDGVSSDPIPSVLVQVRNADESVLLASQETDASGEVGFLLDDGTYKVRLRKLGSYSFSNPETLVVSGATTDTYDGTAFSPSAAPSPETCVVSGYTHDIGDLPISVDVVADLVSPKHFTTGGIQIIKGAKTVSSAALDGYWELVLTRSGEYTGTNVRYSFKVNGIIMREYVIPDQANVWFAELEENAP